MKKTIAYLSIFLFGICQISWGQTKNLDGSWTHANCMVSQAKSKHPQEKAFATSGSATSTNWSGYAIGKAHPEYDIVNYAYGSWTVPTISPSANTTYSSVWVGIDGFSSNSVEQIGTEHDWTNGAQVNYAWFEMYPLGSYQITGFPLNIGDVIGAEVNYLGSNVFQLTLFNYTQKVYFAVPTSYTTSSTAQRNSAEWIVEAPYDGGILPLANFGNVTFTNCTVEINRTTGPINDRWWQNDAINMESSTGAPEAATSALTANGEGFSVTWESE